MARGLCLHSYCRLRQKKWKKVNEKRSVKIARNGDIRRQAEEVLKGKDTDLKMLSVDDVQSIVHELQVHQIELEIQNEELRRTKKELEDAHNRYCDLHDFVPPDYFTLDDK